MTEQPERKWNDFFQTREDAMTEDDKTIDRIYHGHFDARSHEAFDKWLLPLITAVTELHRERRDLLHQRDGHTHGVQGHRETAWLVGGPATDRVTRRTLRLMARKRAQ